MTIGVTQLDTSPTPGPYPVSSVIPTGTSVPKALEGGPVVADTDQKAPASIWVKDGNDVTQGLSTDANTVASVMGRLTKIRDLLLATLVVSGTITEANSAAILAALDMGQENMANSLSVTMASDQSAIPMSSADGSIVTLGTAADANTVNTMMGRLTKIRDLLNATLAVTQSGTWTVQPGNTPNTTPWLVSAGPPADLTLLSSAAQTTTQTLADQANFAGKGIRVVLDMTVVGTGSVTLEIDAKDGASGKYTPLLTGAAVITNSTNVYIIHPELTAAANSIAKDVLPHTWRVKVVANNANPATYSVGASYLN
jgi:hypothetical protein